MDVYGREPLEVAEWLDTYDKDTGTGGCQTTDIRDIFQGGGVGGATIWVIDVGDDPPHGQGPGEFSAQS